VGDVVFLPGTTPADINRGPRKAETVLRWAIENNIQDVTVIGNAPDGTRFVLSSVGDVEKEVGMLMDAVTFLSSGDYLNAPVEADDKDPA
jgi:hypothetical protein